MNIETRGRMQDVAAESSFVASVVCIIALAVWVGALVLSEYHGGIHAWAPLLEIAGWIAVGAGCGVVLSLLIMIWCGLASQKETESNQQKSDDSPNEIRWCRTAPNEQDFAKRNLEDDFRRIQAEINNEQWYYGDYPAPLPNELKKR